MTLGVIPETILDRVTRTSGAVLRPTVVNVKSRLSHARPLLPIRLLTCRSEKTIDVLNSERRSVMQQAHRIDHQDSVGRPSLTDAARIPSLTHREAAEMAAVELERFLTLAESLAPADWEQPTACPLWNVRQVVAHVTGAAAAYASFEEFKRQYSPFVQRPYRRAGFSFLDALNQIQVDDRSTATPAALIAELREVGPRAIATRKRLPALVRAMRLPLPVLGVVPLGYATDLIYTRDMWMHRLDICRASGREMVQTPRHDGRITALVVRDLARKLTPKLAGQAVVYELTGLAGGSFRLGANVSPTARITMDVLDFHLFASGRLPAHELSSHASWSGDEHIARLALDNTQVPY